MVLSLGKVVVFIKIFKLHMTYVLVPVVFHLPVTCTPSPVEQSALGIVSLPGCVRFCPGVPTNILAGMCKRKHTND